MKWYKKQVYKKPKPEYKKNKGSSPPLQGFNYTLFIKLFLALFRVNAFLL